MNPIRCTLLAGILLAGSAHAADVSMAGGEVSFAAPDDWVVIMETQGDPETRVFQVPDPSPTAGSSLARVTVTVKQVAGLAAFEQYVADSTRKSKALTGYQPDGAPQSPNSYAYTAKESGAPYRYSERYWFRNNHAIQLRCARPAQSEAGAAWTTAFDHGCDAVAAGLAR